MEGHADNVQLQLLGSLEQTFGHVHGSTEFLAQAAEGGGIVGRDPQEQLGCREKLLDLVQLIDIVKGHLADTLLGGEAQVAFGLARLGVDDARRINAHGQDLLDLGLAGTVKTGTHLSQELKNAWVGVALHGVVRRDAREVGLPSHVLAVHVA